MEHIRLARSSAIIVKNWAITPTITLNFQKTSFSLYNPLVSNWN